MKSKLNKKRIIIFVLFIMLSGIALFKIADRQLETKDNIVNKLNTNVSIGIGDEYTDWSNGTWDVTTSFSSSGPNVTITEDGAKATLNSNEESLENSAISMTISSKYSGGTYSDLYYQLDLAYKFPLTLFQTNNTYTYSYDQESNKILINKDDNTQVGYIALGDMLYCATEDDACWENLVPFIVEIVGDTLIVYNGDDIESSVDYSADFTLEYALLPSEIMVDSSNEIIPTMGFFGEQNVNLGNLLTEYKYSEEELNLDGITGKEQKVYKSWNTNWGIEQSGYDFYIEYGVSGNIDYSKEYSLLYSLNTNGELLAYSSDGTTFVETNNTSFNSSNTCALTSSGVSAVDCTFVVGYDLGNDSSFESQFQTFMALVDGEKSITAKFDWNKLLEKEVEQVVTYPSGTNKQFTQSLISDDAGVGAINKIRTGQNVDFEWKIEPTAASINNTESGSVKAFNLWNLTQEGTTSYTIDLETTGGYIDNSYNTVVNPFTLTSDEYIYKSFYLLDDIEYVYVLNDARKEYLLSPSDVTTNTAKQVYVKINDGEYELIGSIKKASNGNIVYTANDSRTTANNSVSRDTPVILPDGVTDLKISYEGTKAAVYFGICVNSQLKYSEDLVAEINDLIINNKDIVLKNEAQVSVNSKVENTKLTGTYLTSAYEASTYYGSDSVVNDTYTDEDGAKYDSITYTDYVYEQVEILSGGDSAEAVDYLTEQKNVTIYELLPTGAQLDGNVRVTTYGNETEVSTNVTITDNYDGTGRTLLKIEVNAPVANIYETSTYLKSGYNITFNVLYSYLANQSYGNELNKDMAYYSNGVLTGGYVNASEANSSSFSSNAIQNTMNKLNPSNKIKNSIYMTENTTVNKVTVTVGKFIKETKSILDPAYANSTNVMETAKYKYRLKYVFSSDYEEITNLVFVDKLESSYGDKKYFKGYLDSVDTSYLDNLGVSTSVYYSTNKDVNLDNIDLTDTSSWSTSKPSDVTKIVAVAVSCGNYVFKGSDKVTPMVEINMIATNEYNTNVEKKAYNNSFINYNYLGDSVVKSMTSEVTSVGLEKATIDISATTSVGTGSKENPAVVNDAFNYSVTLSNTGDKADLKNITFEVTLPEGLSINTDNITEVSDNGSGVFGTYSYNNATRVLTYSLDNLLVNEVKNITIPIDMDYTVLSGVMSFTGSVQLKTVGGKAYNSEAIKLYNKLAVPKLEYVKYVKTKDTVNFTDEAKVIIEKGETYTYRVNINNTSTIAAKGIEVVDNVPSGLTVVRSSITNGGVYDSTNNTITWNIDTLNANKNINLDYNVTVANNITLGTKYRSSAHINVINPIDPTLMLYDDDTNIINTLYQIVSNLKVTNNVTGALADKNKGFTYNFEFSGDPSYTGEYDVVNASGTKVDTLTLDSNGKGNYNKLLKGSESLEFKLLPNGITYKIKQNMEEGYTTVSDSATNVDGAMVITGTTGEVKQVNYAYTNNYDVSTTADISATITYDKEITSDMFALTITDSDGKTVTKYSDESGIVNFDTITYDNVDGVFTYNVTQDNTKVNKVSYDTNTFKVVVTLTNDGKGNLNKNIKYYNKLNEEVSEIKFNNEYVPNGFIVNSVNTSDYVDSTKVFKYRLDITNSQAGNYVVKDTDGNELTELVIDDEGNGSYEFELKSDKKITILDLPNGTNYTIKQDLVEYYTTTLDELSYNVDLDNKIITHSGTILDSTIQIDFKNNYVTSGSFTPSSVVNLLEKELEESEFTFILKDVSEGLTNGYFEYVTNTVEGYLNFTTIEYTRPGTYVYEISQVKGDSNHIYYDLSKCTLTVTLVDNGDSTMSVESALYNYSSGKDYFENKYSKEPIVPPVQEDINKNPNTSETINRFGILAGMIAFVSGLFVVEKWMRKKRLTM